MTWWSRPAERGRRERALAEEVEAHLAERVDDLVEAGLPIGEARQQARREFGNITRHVEDSREVWLWRGAADSIRAFRQAMRSVQASLRTLSACLIVLGLSSGLFATVLVMTDVMVFRPIHLKALHRLVVLGGLTEPGLGWDAVAWWGQARSFERLVLGTAGQLQVVVDGESRTTTTVAVSPGFFAIFEGRAALGRVFDDSDYAGTGPLAVVVSEQFWERRLSRRSTAVGSKILIGDIEGVVVGVMPPSFTHSFGADVWTVRRPADAIHVRFIRRTESQWAALLAPGQSAESANSELQGLLARLNETHTPKTGRNYGEITEVTPLREVLSRPVRAPMLALLGGTSVVLFLALTNAAMLFLGYVLERRQEFAVRAALGATRGRVLAQLVLESVIIGSAAGALGGVGGVLLFGAVRSQIVPLSPLLGEPTVSIVIVVVGLLTGGVLGVLAGLSPVVVSVVWSDWHLLQHRASDRGSRRGHRLRAVLVVAQVAAAMALIVCAGVAVRTFVSMSRVTLGFEPKSVLAAKVALPANARADALATQLIDSRIVSAAAVATQLPVAEDRGYWFMGRQSPTAIRVLEVGPNFFAALGVPILNGRDFRPDDRNTAIVSRQLAREVWADRNPIGEQLHLNGEVWEVVAVVGDIRETVEADQKRDLQVYVPLPNVPSNSVSRGPVLSSLVMQCGNNCNAALSRVRTQFEAFGAEVFWMDTMEGVLGSKLTPARTHALITLVYGTLGFVLAVAGIYSLVCYVIAARVREIGIRVALGASSSAMRSLVLGYSFRICVVGIVIGAGLSWPMLSLVRSLIHGVSLADPMTYGGAALTIVLGAIVAVSGPARRLTRLDLHRILNQ